jgi:hypothetical protein
MANNEYTPFTRVETQTRKPGEVLWEPWKGQEMYRCELRSHADWGCELQIFTGNRNLDSDDHFVLGQHYPIREMALSEAERLRDVYSELGYKAV